MMDDLIAPVNEKPTNGGYDYARGYQFVDNFGADAWLDVWSSPRFNLTRCPCPRSGLLGVRAMASRRLKLGWQVFPDKWGVRSSGPVHLLH